MIFTVQEASHKKAVNNDKGQFQVVNLALVDGDGAVKVAEWFTKADTTIPNPGVKLEGDLAWSEQFNVFKFKKAGGGFGGGGGGGRKDTPETRRSIAMQHAQKCAVSVLAVAAEHGEYTPPNAGDVVKQVKTVAATLYLQVMAAERDEIAYGRPLS